MKCTSPITVISNDGRAAHVRCKQCTPCRIWRQNTWMARNLIEYASCVSAHFLTLTYSDDTRPAHPDLCKRESGLYLKRLRRRFPRSVRFFSLIERGEKYGKLHHHLLLYHSDHKSASEVRDTSLWPHGRSHVGEVTPASVRYVTQYCLKHYDAPQDRPITSMSKSPPLGSRGMYLLGQAAARAGKSILDMDGTVEIGSKTYPTDSTMLRYFAAGYRDCGGIIPSDYPILRADKLDEIERLLPTDYEKLHRNILRIEQRPADATIL